jgi:peptidyl-prolyl cis-trans isomerase C
MRRFETALVVLVFASAPLAAQTMVGGETENTIEIVVNSEILAEQGGVEVTKADLAAFLSRIPEEHRGGFLRSRDRIGRALDNLMLPRLITAAAKEDGLLDDPAIHGQLYQSAVILISQEYMDRYFMDQELDDYSALARELYLTEPERFQSEPTVSFTHVLVQVGVDRGELGGMRSIFSIYDRLQAGESLETLARELSDDPGVKDNQGSYVDVSPATLDPAVATALSIMSPGDISEPVRSEFGWHILRLDERTPAEQLDWEEARERALEVARTEHMETARERLVQRLRADNGQMEVDVPALQRFLDQYELEWELYSEAPESETEERAD